MLLINKDIFSPNKTERKTEKLIILKYYVFCGW